MRRVVLGLLLAAGLLAVASAAGGPPPPGRPLQRRRSLSDVKVCVLCEACLRAQSYSKGQHGANSPPSYTHRTHTCAPTRISALIRLPFARAFCRLAPAG